MNSRLLQLLLGLSLLLNTFVLVGFVYRSWIVPPFEASMPPPPPPPQPRLLDALAHELNLDDGQRQALRSVIDRQAGVRRDRGQEILRLREDVAAELRRPQPDLGKADAMIDQISHLRGEQIKENLRTLSQLEPRLRPDQVGRMYGLFADRFVGPPAGARPRAPGNPAPGNPPGSPPRPPQ